jgi:tryptophan-rich sensory protein
MKNKIIKLIAAILLCELAGGIGSLFTYPSIEGWYAKLQKPSFNPPNWVFAPVWVTLYLLMGISAYLVWEKNRKSKEAKKSLSIFGMQLVLNMLWSIVFFGLQSLLFGLIDIILLWIAIVVTVFKFFRISRTAGLLLIPYVLWVTFAMILNFYIWRLN